MALGIASNARSFGPKSGDFNTRSMNLTFGHVHTAHHILVSRGGNEVVTRCPYWKVWTEPSLKHCEKEDRSPQNMIQNWASCSEPACGLEILLFAPKI